MVGESEVARAPSGAPAAGHRLLPHTADCILEAWGPDLLTCATEALMALVEELAEVSDAAEVRVVPIGADASSPADLVVQLLEEVVYTLDVFAVVPVRFHLAETEGGGIAGDMEVVPFEQAVIVGAVPKGVSYHELSVEHDERGWRCHVLVDI